MTKEKAKWTRKGVSEVVEKLGFLVMLVAIVAAMITVFREGHSWFRYLMGGGFVVMMIGAAIAPQGEVQEKEEVVH
jgi:hypothetical membrane protein